MAGIIQNTVNQLLGVTAGISTAGRVGKTKAQEEIKTDLTKGFKGGKISPQMRQKYGEAIGKKNQFARKNFDEEIMKKAIDNISSEQAAKISMMEAIQRGFGMFKGGKQ